MPTLPPAMLRLLAPFAPRFARRVWPSAWCWSSGPCSRREAHGDAQPCGCWASLTPGVLTRYHRVLNRARWSSLAVSRALLGLSGPRSPRRGRCSSAWMRRLSAGGAPRSRPRASIATRCAPARATSSRPAGCAGCA